MPAQVPREGRLAEMEKLRTELLTGSRVVLFSNNLTPDRDTIFADLVEPAFTGYAPETPGSWSAVVETADHHYQTTAATVTFTNESGSGQDVYGYGLVSADDELLLVERFPAAPFTMLDLVPFPISVTHQLTSEFNP